MGRYGFNFDHNLVRPDGSVWPMGEVNEFLRIRIIVKASFSIKEKSKRKLNRRKRSKKMGKLKRIKQSNVLKYQCLMK